MTKKKFAELELSLLHLQQNVEIPETHLIIHPVIQRAVEQVRTFYLGAGIVADSHSRPRRMAKDPIFRIYPPSFSTTVPSLTPYTAM